MNMIKWLSITERYMKMYLDRKLSSLGINSSQHMYIMKVCQEPGITQDSFMECFYVHPSNITRAMIALEKGGYLERRSYEGDKRTCRLFPTEKGIQISGQIQKICQETEEMLLKRFTQEEAITFQRLLQIAGENVVSNITI